MRIEACFDSHVHWAATGEFAQRLPLGHWRSVEDVRSLKPSKSNFRGEWLLGFGWDETGWDNPPHRRFLDAVFSTVPVAFSRCDGHSLWVNTEALKRAGLWQQSQNAAAVTSGAGRIVRDEQGWPTGLLVDQACFSVEKLIPEPSSLELRRHLLMAIKHFNEAGFTHIRDMTCNEAQWNEALKLDASGLLTLAVEEYFWVRDPASLLPTLDLCGRARQAPSPNLRVKGVKIFLDGALGSEGAWLSCPYHGGSHHGLAMWSTEDLHEALRATWERGFEIAVHALGDQAGTFSQS